MEQGGGLCLSHAALGPMSSRKQIRTQNRTNQWQGRERVCRWNEGLGFLNLVGKGGKPHLTKLFRCVVENLITFGHLNENQMWLWPRRPAMFKAQCLSYGLQALCYLTRLRASSGGPLPGSWGGGFQALWLDFRGWSGQSQLPGTWFPGRFSKLFPLPNHKLWA